MKKLLAGWLVWLVLALIVARRFVRVRIVAPFVRRFGRTCRFCCEPFVGRGHQVEGGHLFCWRCAKSLGHFFEGR